jgi:hypothetical protein
MTSGRQVAQSEAQPVGSEKVESLLRRGARAMIPNCVRARISELIRGRLLPYRRRDWDAEYGNGSWNRLGERVRARAL